MLNSRCIATCKPGKPRIISFSETPALFFIQFLSFRPGISEKEGTGQTKWSVELTRKNWLATCLNSNKQFEMDGWLTLQLSWSTSPLMVVADIRDAYQVKYPPSGSRWTRTQSTASCRPMTTCVVLEFCQNLWVH